MVLDSAPTNISSGGDDTLGQTTFVTPSFSPPDGTLLKITIVVSDGDGSPAITSVTDTLSGTGTWTEDITEADGSFARISLWTARAGPNPGSGAITANFESAGRTSFILAHIKGADNVTPVSATASNNGTGTTQIVTLAAPTSGNLTYAGICSIGDSTGITPGSGWTEHDEDTSGSPNEARVQTQFALTEADPDWSDLATTDNAAFAVEIAAALLADERSYPRGVQRGILRGVL